MFQRKSKSLTNASNPKQSQQQESNNRSCQTAPRRLQRSATTASTASSARSRERARQRRQAAEETDLREQLGGESGVQNLAETVVQIHRMEFGEPSGSARQRLPGITEEPDNTEISEEPEEIEAQAGPSGSQQSEAAEQSDADEFQKELNKAQQAHQTAQVEAQNAVTARRGDFSHVRAAFDAYSAARKAAVRMRVQIKKLEKKAAVAKKNEQQAITALHNAEQNSDPTVQQKRNEKAAASKQVRQARERANRASKVTKDTEDLAKKTGELAKETALSSQSLPARPWKNAMMGLLGNMSIGFTKGASVGTMVQAEKSPMVTPGPYVGGGIGAVLGGFMMPGFCCPTCGSVDTSTINNNLCTTVAATLAGGGALYAEDVEGNYGPGIGAIGGLLLTGVDYKNLSNAKCGVCHTEWNAFKHAGEQTKGFVKNIWNRRTVGNQTGISTPITGSNSQTSIPNNQTPHVFIDMENPGNSQ